MDPRFSSHRGSKAERERSSTLPHKEVSNPTKCHLPRKALCRLPGRQRWIKKRGKSVRGRCFCQVIAYRIDCLSFNRDSPSSSSDSSDSSEDVRKRSKREKKKDKKKDKKKKKRKKKKKHKKDKREQKGVSLYASAASSSSGHRPVSQPISQQRALPAVAPHTSLLSFMQPLSTGYSKDRQFATGSAYK